MLIVRVDVGSVQRTGGFSWASSDERLRGQDDPSALGRLIAAALDDPQQVALAVECPLAVPIPDTTDNDWQNLGRARHGEGNRPWSAGAGTCALPTGLVQLARLCRFLARTVEE